MSRIRRPLVSGCVVTGSGTFSVACAGAGVTTLTSGAAVGEGTAGAGSPPVTPVRTRAADAAVTGVAGSAAAIERVLSNNRLLFKTPILGLVESDQMN